MYVNFDSDCVDLNFLLGSSSGQNREWKIKISQFDSGFPNLAPAGCTQYFWGEEENTINSFNWNNGNGFHLADQKQVICIRREEGKSRICYTTVNDQFDINISGNFLIIFSFKVHLASVLKQNWSKGLKAMFEGHDLDILYKKT